MLLLVADGLIKMYKSGLLERVVESFECVIPDIVYHEAVTKGKEGHYADAYMIEHIVSNAIVVEQTNVAERPHVGFGLGGGEIGIIGLKSTQRYQNAIVVSDDRRFLTLLADRGVAFLTPASLIVGMVRSGLVDVNEARMSLMRLRPFVREDLYRQAIEELERGVDKLP